MGKVRDKGLGVPVTEGLGVPVTEGLGVPVTEGLGVPVTEGGMVDQALADRGPARGLDEVGFQARLIDEDQPFQHVGHVRLAGLDPDPAPLRHLGPQDFACEQRFSYG